MAAGLSWAAGMAVVGAPGLWAALISRQLVRRPVELAWAEAALDALRTEIAYARTPLPQALRRAAAGGRGPAVALLRQSAAALEAGSGCSPEQAWERALAAADERSAWSEADVAALSRLGNALGRSDAGEQVRHIRMCVERLRALEEEARGEAGRQARMWLYLGFSLGVALVLVLR